MKPTRLRRAIVVVALALLATIGHPPGYGLVLAQPALDLRHRSPQTEQ